MPEAAPTRLSYSCPECFAVPEDFAVSCKTCGCDLKVNDPRSDEALAKSLNRKEQSVFFYVSPLKLLLMSIGTLGFYEFFWFYKNWTYVREHRLRDLSPEFRALFFPFTYYYLLKEIERAGEAQRRDFNVPLLPLGIAYFFVLYVLPSVSGGLWILCGVVGPMLLLPAQNFVNTLNEGCPSPINSRFSIGNIIVMLFGFSVLALNLLGELLGGV